MITGAWKKFDELVWGDSLYQYGLAGRVLVGILRNLYAVTRDIISGQLTLRSMSLVYTTLLSVVPLMAFSFSVLKGLGVHKDLEARLYTLLEPLGDKGVEITDQLMRLVNNVNGSVLGGIGLAFFIYTAISMVQKIEEAFNYVWYVSEPRSFARRFTEYMLVLLIGPVLIMVALGAIASLQNEAIVQWLAESTIFGPVFTATTQLTPFMIVTAVFSFLYFYMPNTNVRALPAIVGGLAGGFMWATVGMIFAAFVSNSARTQAIYASFAIAITTLIWLYLNWLILLIGSQIAFYYQNPAYLRIGRREPRLSNSMRERLALNIMLAVALNLFIGFAGQRATEDEELVPGREMSRVRLIDILAVVRSEGETGSYQDPRWSKAVDHLGEAIDTAVDESLAGKTLSELLDETYPDDQQT